MPICDLCKKDIKPSATFLPTKSLPDGSMEIVNRLLCSKCADIESRILNKANIYDDESDKS